MKSKKTSQSSYDGLALIVLAVLMFGLSFGCTTTVTPVTVKASAPSWDGSHQDSGLAALLPDHSALLTDSARERYAGLAAQYGTKFTPKVTGFEAVEYDGTTATNSEAKVVTLDPTRHYWHLDTEHLAKFGLMAHWKHQDAKP